MDLLTCSGHHAHHRLHCQNLEKPGTSSKHLVPFSMNPKQMSTLLHVVLSLLNLDRVHVCTFYSNLSCLLRSEWRHQMWKVLSMSGPALPFTGCSGLPVNVPYRTGSPLSAGSGKLKVSLKVFCQDHGLRGAQGSGALCWPDFPLHAGAFFVDMSEAPAFLLHL